MTTFINLAAEDMFCPDLKPPENGEVQFTTKIGDTATYTCSDGYILSGNSMRLCLPGGIWNGTEPVCNRKIINIKLINVTKAVVDVSIQHSGAL